MARVFVSYRRADGRVGVDWLAERLKALDAVNGVQTAFHDGGLQAGESFADALEAELTEADLVVAFIGPNWEGRSDTGLSRIQEDEDWVVREIALAFELDTKVIPIILDGAEQPRASDLHASIAQLPEKHSLPLSKAADVDKIVAHIVGHLAGIDIERARLADLEERVRVPDITKPSKLVALCIAGGLVGFLLALAAGFWLPDNPTHPTLRETPAWSWFRVLLLLIGTWLGAIIPVGYLISRRIVRSSIVQWKSLAAAGLLVGGVPALLSGNDSNSLMVLTLDSSDNIDYSYLRSIGGIVFIAVAVAAWVVAIGAAVYTTPDAQPHELGKRALNLAIIRDGERWGVVLVSVIIAVSTGLNVALAAAADQGEIDGFEFDERSLITMPIILSALVVIVHRWATTRLDDADEALGADLDELPLSYRTNATPNMAVASLSHLGWGFRAVLSLPVAVAVLAVFLHRLT